MSSKTINEYQRETDEFVKVIITLNGVATITGVSFAVVPANTRPVTFTAAVVRGSDIGFELKNLTAGYYEVFAKMIDNTFLPVISCGTIKVL